MSETPIHTNFPIRQILAKCPEVMRRSRPSTEASIVNGRDASSQGCRSLVCAVLRSMVAKGGEGCGRHRLSERRATRCRSGLLHGTAAAARNNDERSCLGGPGAVGCGWERRQCQTRVSRPSKGPAHAGSDHSPKSAWSLFFISDALRRHQFSGEINTSPGQIKAF